MTWSPLVEMVWVLVRRVLMKVQVQLKLMIYQDVRKVQEVYVASLPVGKWRLTPPIRSIYGIFTTIAFFQISCITLLNRAKTKNCLQNA